MTAALRKFIIRRSFGNYFYGFPTKEALRLKIIMFVDQRASISVVAPSLLI
jgi:hypothetical protein